MMRETPNFTYEQHLGCPVCNGMLQKMYYPDRFGRMKRHAFSIQRAEKYGQWCKDDVLKENVEQIGPYTKRRKGRVWVHRVDLVCSECGRVLNRAQAIEREFAESELPRDFWEAPVGTYIDETAAAEDAQPDLFSTYEYEDD